MKQILLFVSVMGFALFTFAQDLPRPSSHAKVEQTIGLTQVSIEYHRPSVKNREIFGGLVPFDEMWRAGANKATLFSTSYDIRINGSNLPKGDYSLFIKPTANEKWEVYFNSETELWGTGNLDESKTVLKAIGSVQRSNDKVETLEYSFENVTMKGKANVVMEWENMKMILEIEADPMEQALQNIEKALAEAKEENKWKVYRTAASFAEGAKMTDEGLEWIESSVNLKENWYSFWVYAELLAQSGDYQGAIEKAQRSIEVGEAASAEEGKEFQYAEDLNADIEKWSNKK